uniref:Uncharacterized protein n=1 Tax=viral metagenome TaxID=1070528 RepID=A0A6C0K0A8_9ZZZZ
MTTENISIEMCESDTAYDTHPSIETSDFGLTRYLYVLDDVKSSLVMAILDRKRDEALFWAYELYFSGLKADVFCILEQMVSMMYVSLNPRLGKFLEKKKHEWNETGAYCIVGTFIYNMVNRPYDISTFVKTFCKDTELLKYIDTQSITKSPPGAKLGHNIYINVEQKDVVKYITINHIKPHYLLRKTVKYPVRKNTLAIFDHEHNIYTHIQIQSLYWYYWLYYAGASPIWAERIAKYGGIFNHEKHRIDFDTVEHDEAFHEKYNLEPDEQPLQLQEMNIGTGLDHQLTWAEFYEKYA